MTSVVARHRTAMSRTFLSRPVQQALNDGLFEPGLTFFDYGCGRGGDVRYLRQLGFEAAGWDPVHAGEVLLQPSSIVNLGFVVNVIEDRAERAAALRTAWNLAHEVLIVAARLDWEAGATEGEPFQDGILTKKGTFQKYFSQDELRSWIDHTLGHRSVAAAPGIFYIFRTSEAEQRLLARHSRRHNRPKLSVAELVYRQHESLLTPLADWVRTHRQLPTAADLDAMPLIETFGSIRAAFSLIRRVPGSGQWSNIDLGGRQRSEDRFEANLEIIEPLIGFLTERGRLPRDDELPQTSALKTEFGSIRAAFSLIRRVAGSERWVEYEARARQDFLVYLALAAFSHRPTFSELPADLQYDTRDFFGSYKKACAQADQLLYGVGDLDAINLACRSAGWGKLTAEALYVHTGGVANLAAVLRVYIGCAEALTGTVENATLLKLHREKPQVSFLIYPEFDADPHPTLSASIVARLRELRVSYKDFAGRENPPILHRKETFVPPDYPGRAKFARLTSQEERHDLLDSPTIGTANGWQATLAAAGLHLRGHRLMQTAGDGPGVISEASVRP